MTMRYTPPPWDVDVRNGCCDDPKCPDNVDRLKLEAFYEMKAAAEKMALFIGRWGKELVGVQMSPQDFKEDCGLCEYHAALAKAEKLG